MSSHKFEPGDRMTQQQEDYAAGRLDFQKEQALEAQKVRRYIIEHPGCISKDIKDALGMAKVSGPLDWLIKRRLIRYTTAGYEVIPL